MPALLSLVTGWLQIQTWGKVKKWGFSERFCDNKNQKTKQYDLNTHKKNPQNSMKN